MTTQRIRRFNPIQTGKFMGMLYGLIGLVFVPFVFLFSMMMPNQASGGFGTIFLVLMPVLYAIFGGLMSALAAVIYNVVAGMVGGLEIDLE